MARLGNARPSQDFQQRAGRPWRGAGANSRLPQRASASHVVDAKVWANRKRTVRERASVTARTPGVFASHGGAQGSSRASRSVAYCEGRRAPPQLRCIGARSASVKVPKLSAR